LEVFFDNIVIETGVVITRLPSALPGTSEFDSAGHVKPPSLEPLEAQADGGFH